jgi:hypothetical protein
MNPIFVLIAQRIALGLVTLWFVSFGVFFAIEALPGDTAEAILGQSATPEAVASLREELNLDRPALERYWDWQLGVLSGEFGQSLSNGRPVSGLISTRLGNTLFLAEGLRRLNEICDPEAVNRRVFDDQRRRIADLGGPSACRAQAFGHTPAPEGV